MEVIKVERFLVKVNETLSFELTRPELARLQTQIRKLLDCDIPRFESKASLIDKIWSQGEY